MQEIIYRNILEKNDVNAFDKLASVWLDLRQKQQEERLPVDDINQLFACGCDNPFIIAALHGSINIMTRLKEMGVELPINEPILTPAVKNQFTDVVRWMVEQSSIDYDAQDAIDALFQAVDRRDVVPDTVINLLVTHGKYSSANLLVALQRYCAVWSNSEIKELLVSKITLTHEDSELSLILDIFNNSPEIGRSLLSRVSKFSLLKVSPDQRLYLIDYFYDQIAKADSTLKEGELIKYLAQIEDLSLSQVSNKLKQELFDKLVAKGHLQKSDVSWINLLHCALEVQRLKSNGRSWSLRKRNIPVAEAEVSVDNADAVAGMKVSRKKLSIADNLHMLSTLTLSLDQQDMTTRKKEFLLTAIAIIESIPERSRSALYRQCANTAIAKKGMTATLSSFFVRIATDKQNAATYKSVEFEYYRNAANNLLVVVPRLGS